MKASEKAHDSKAKAAEKETTTRAAKTETPEPSIASQLVSQLDQVERDIQSLNGQFANIDDGAKATLTTDQLYRIERLSALADRSKSGTDAIAAPANTTEPVAPTSQPPVHRFVHGEPATTQVVKTPESEEAAKISRGEKV